MSASPFDIVQHHRKRTRRAEGRADGLERELAKALRLLGLAVTTAAGEDCDPLTLLRVLEAHDAEMQRPRRGPSIDELVQLLRETDPAAVAA